MIFFLFFPQNMIWHFMKIVFLVFIKCQTHFLRKNSNIFQIVVVLPSMLSVKFELTCLQRYCPVAFTSSIRRPTTLADKEPIRANWLVNNLLLICSSINSSDRCLCASPVTFRIWRRYSGPSPPYRIWQNYLNSLPYSFKNSNSSILPPANVSYESSEWIHKT